MGVFPGAIPAAGTAVPTATLVAAGHTALHNTDRDEIRAIATKLGVDGSAVVTTHDYKLSNVPDGEKATTVSEVLESMYPIGSIYMNATNSENPADLLGIGSWVAFGQGKVPVGIDSGDADFDAPEETGGAKTVAGASHTHTLSDSGQAQITIAAATPSAFIRRITTASYVSTHVVSGAGAGSGGTAQTTGAPLAGATDSATPSATSVVQPYIVVYMWKRTA